MTVSPRWFTSSYSDNGGACVEVATNLAAEHGVVPVRDSKVAQGPMLSVGARGWGDFVSAVRSGEVSA